MNDIGYNSPKPLPRRSFWQGRWKLFFPSPLRSVLMLLTLATIFVPVVLEWMGINTGSAKSLPFIGLPVFTYLLLNSAYDQRRKTSNS